MVGFSRPAVAARFSGWVREPLIFSAGFSRLLSRRARRKPPGASGGIAAAVGSDVPADDTVTTPGATGGLPASADVTVGNWYTFKAVIDDDPNNSALQRLRFYVDGTEYLSTLVVDDDWSAGCVGFVRGSQTAVAEQFDDFKVGIDNNADGDIADAGDDLQIDDNFDSGVLSLTYDDNGNLTNDGIFGYVYDAWNRLVTVKRIPDAQTTIAVYAYDGHNRRMSKVVSNQGDEIVANDGGNTTIHFYYGSSSLRGSVASSLLPWNIVETRNGSNHSTRQWLWGTRYIDEVLCMDVNSPSDSADDCDPDTTGANDAADGDKRYFYHQDRNWNVVALTAYGGGDNGKVVERYASSSHEYVTTIAGAIAGNELGAIRAHSSIGNIFIQVTGAHWRASSLLDIPHETPVRHIMSLVLPTNGESILAGPFEGGQQSCNRTLLEISDVRIRHIARSGPAYCDLIPDATVKQVALEQVPAQTDNDSCPPTCWCEGGTVIVTWQNDMYFTVSTVQLGCKFNISGTYDIRLTVVANGTCRCCDPIPPAP